MRVGMYARVSTEEQKVFGLSIEAQKAALKEWAKKERVKVVDYYVDAGLSARKPATKRPELQRLLNDVREKKIDLIVFTKLDRWFRSVGEYYKVQEILEKYNVNWKTIHEDYDTLSASGRLKINIMLAVAQDEADRTSERIKAVFDRKKQLGEPVSGMAPLGYVVKDKKLLIDEEKAPMARDLFRAFLELRSASATQRYMRLTHNLNYDTSTLKKLLRNRKYIGEAYGIPDFCEPMIDRDTFQVVQETLAYRAQRNSCKPAGRIYIFKGLLTCAECGHTMTACACKGHYYYRCTRRAYVGDCKFDKYIREDEIEQYLLENLLKKCHEYNTSVTKRANSKPKVDEAAIKRKLDKLKDLYLSDLILKEDYENEFKSLLAALDDAQSVVTAEPELIDIEALRNAMSAYASLDKPHKKQLWGMILGGVTVNADETFSFTLRNT